MFNNEKNNLRMLIVTVCVNYCDYLEMTWENNKEIISKFDYWVITDLKDKQTEQFCKNNRINLHKTDVFYQKGSSFNKGAALNHFFLNGSVNYKDIDWILLLDSDIILNKSIESFIEILKQNPPGVDGNLYSCSRKVYKTKEDYLNDNFWWEICHFIGYFQLFNKKIILEKLQKKENIFLEFHNSAVYDMEFANSFGKNKVGLSDVCHLGIPCQNWDGRVFDNFFTQNKKKEKKEEKEDLSFVLSEAFDLLDKKDILFKEEFELKAHTDKLKYNIEKWADQNCGVYKNKSSLFSKKDLEDKSNWYVKEISNNSRHVYTSGTTTGNPFEYMRWDSIFHKIEWANHYDMILDEFDVNESPHILYFLPHSYETYGDEFVYCSGKKSEYDFINHGSQRNPIIHYVNFDLYKNKTRDFFLFLFDYLTKNKIDVIHTTAPQVNSFCNHLKKIDLKQNLGYLLSTTGERLLPEDAAFLIEGGYFDHICDHMRCWDGGGSFFTCKYRNYHLMDNLAWCEEGPNHEFICTDYFNLASPFVRYWNGDYCRIDNRYQRCECGRLYRDFEFLESRPFSLKGRNMQEIKEKIASLGISDIKQVRCSVSDLNVISSRELSEEEKIKISSVSDIFSFKFNVE